METGALMSGLVPSILAARRAAAANRGCHWNVLEEAYSSLKNASGGVSLAFRPHTVALAALLTLGLSSSPLLSAQQPPTVEILKLYRIPQPGPTWGGWHTRRDSYELPSDTLMSMMELAFSIGPTRIVGAPQWAKTVRYELVFRPPSGQVDWGLAGFRQEQRMLRAILIDRFHLKFRRETRPEEARVLALGAQGTRLQVSQPSAGEWHWKGIILKPGLLACSAAPMDQLTFMMSLSLGQTVVDQSGLHGLYDCEARWQSSTTPLHPHEWVYQGGGLSSDPRFESGAAPSSSTLDAALQDQLGLTLSSTETVPVEVLVVDAAQQPAEDLSAQPTAAR
jgi:uncharacterized protein (TIGR03435 family)